MPRQVKGPDGIVRSFPDDATDDEIASALGEDQPTPEESGMPKPLDPRFLSLWEQGADARSSGARSALSAVLMANAPGLLPSRGMLAKAINTPVGLGATTTAYGIAQGEDPVSAAKTGVLVGAGLKYAPGIAGVVLGKGGAAKLEFLLKKLGTLGPEERAAAAMASETAAAEAAAAREMVSSGAVPSRVVPIRPNVNVTAGARPIPPAAPAVAPAAVPVVEEVAAPVAKAAAKARAPRAPKVKVAPPQSEIESQLAKSLELAQNRVAGKPFRVGTAAPKAPSLPNADELQSFVLEKYGQGMSKPQIVNSIKDVYGLPDVPGPRGKAIGYWKDAVDLILGVHVGVK